MDNYKTGILEEKIIHCDNLEDLRSEVLANVKTHKEVWKEKINAIIKESGYNKTKFAKLCSVSRVMVMKWCNGAFPQSRETFIKIGFAAKYNLQEMNLFLQRYGKYPALYAKSLEDSVCIFVLSSSHISHTYEECEKIMEKIKNEMQAEEKISMSYETSKVLNNIINLSTEAELLEFIKKNSTVYQDAYRKFYAYVEVYLKINAMDWSSDKVRSTYSLAEYQKWSSSLRQCISKIHNKRWLPIRRKVISLGLHLNMDLEQINEMLQLAQMEVLCAKNPIEGAIIYAIEDASLKNMIFQDGSNELCAYVKYVLGKLQLEESTEFLNDL